MASINLENVGLTFSLQEHRRVALKDYVIKRLFLRSSNPVMRVPALQNINLEVHEGDRLGIIGHNGAGKSTLLKVLAGVYPPTEGRRLVNGQISSLFDLTLGFEPDASGWENMAYRGYLQGETPRTIRAKMQAIDDFSELGDFLNTPVRYYSSGMTVRLAFSIATAIDPEILLIDEVLSAGDLSFQRKAGQRMQEMINKARLIVMVSHDLGGLKKFCNRAIWMDHGRVRMTGSTDDVLAAYTVKMEGITPPAPAANETPLIKLAS